MEGASSTQQRSCLIQSRDQISKLLPDVLVELVNAYYPYDRDQASPTATLMHELRFNRTPDHAHPCLLCIMCERPMFRLMGREPWEQHPSFMLLRVNGGRGETQEATKARFQNEFEQDRIAKALEPVVAEHLLQKLPKVLEDMIRWWATEPSPPATLISTLKFRQSRTHEFHNDGLDSTVVECGDAAHFFRNNCYPRCQYRRYLHSDFDDRLHPHHFGIVVVLKRLRNIDPLARYGETVIRELPDGWEVSADLGYHPTARLINKLIWDQRIGESDTRTLRPHLRRTSPTNNHL